MYTEKERKNEQYDFFPFQQLHDDQLPLTALFLHGFMVSNKNDDASSSAELCFLEY